MIVMKGMRFMLKKIKSLILICLITAMIFPFGGVGIRSASAEVLPPFTSIVIDDGNAGYTASGTWRVSTGVKGYNNSSTRYTCCWQIAQVDLCRRCGMA